MSIAVLKVRYNIYTENKRYVNFPGGKKEEINKTRNAFCPHSQHDKSYSTR